MGRTRAIAWVAIRKHCRSEGDSIAAIAGGDGMALPMVSHEGEDRSEFAGCVIARLREVAVKNPEQQERAVTILPYVAETGRFQSGAG